MFKPAISTKEVSQRGQKQVQVKSGTFTEFYPWNYELSPVDNHEAAALDFHSKMGWDRLCVLVGGVTHNGYVFVQQDFSSNVNWIKQSRKAVTNDIQN